MTPDQSVKIGQILCGLHSSSLVCDLIERDGGMSTLIHGSFYFPFSDSKIKVQRRVSVYLQSSTVGLVKTDASGK